MNITEFDKTCQISEVLIRAMLRLPNVNVVLRTYTCNFQGIVLSIGTKRRSKSRHQFQEAPPSIVFGGKRLGAGGDTGSSPSTVFVPQFASPPKTAADGQLQTEFAEDSSFNLWRFYFQWC